MNEKTTSTPSKRGRKPLGERPMTPAERKQASRRRLAADGTGEFMIRVGRGTLNFIDQFAIGNGQTRSQIVEMFLDLGISRVALAVTEVELLLKNGATEAEVAQVFRKWLSTSPEPHAIDKYKEVMGIK